MQIITKLNWNETSALYPVSLTFHLNMFLWTGEGEVDLSLHISISCPLLHFQATSKRGKERKKWSLIHPATIRQKYNHIVSGLKMLESQERAWHNGNVRAIEGTASLKSAVPSIFHRSLNFTGSSFFLDIVNWPNQKSSNWAATVSWLKWPLKWLILS